MRFSAGVIDWLRCWKGYENIKVLCHQSLQIAEWQLGNLQWVAPVLWKRPKDTAEKRLTGIAIGRCEVEAAQFYPVAHHLV